MTEASLSATGQVRLQDGRMLGYSATGPRDGLPLLYMHGAIGSPVRRTPELERAIESLRLRYLMVDRPGFGGSDASPGRTVADFAGDVEQLADTLGLDRFAVVGCSAGGPYALACSWAMPDRVAASAAVGGVTPGLRPWRAAGMGVIYRLGLSAVVGTPQGAAALGDAALRLLRRHPALLAHVLRAGAPRADRELLASPEASDTAVRSFFAAAARGVRPMIEDYVACTGAWGFDPTDVRGLVHLWHGLGDRLVPFHHAERLAAALPRCVATVADDDGHFFFRARLTEILSPLALALGSSSDTSVDLAA